MPILAASVRPAESDAAAGTSEVAADASADEVPVPVSTLVAAPGAEVVDEADVSDVDDVSGADVVDVSS